MQKKILRKILWMGILCVALMVGCGQIQSEESEETLKAVEKNGAEEIGDMVEDIVSEAETHQDKIVTELTARIEGKSAIQGETDASELIGTWSLTFDNAKVIEDEFELNDEFPGFHGEFDLTIYLTFYDDDTYAIYVDEVEVEPAWQSYLESMAQFTVDYAYDMLSESGLSKEEIDLLIKKEYGMSLYDYMLEELVSAVSVEDFVKGICASGVYEVRGNELHMDEHVPSDYDFEIYTIEGDTLTITPPEGVEVKTIGIEAFDYPYVFTRVTE